MACQACTCTAHHYSSTTTFINAYAVCMPLAAFAPPPVADTKANFLTHYSKPIPAIYNVVLQELLVQQHFIRYKPACSCSQSNQIYQI